MKRIKILFATILIAVFTLSLASCSLFGGRDNDGDKGGNNEVTDGDTSGTGGGNSENNDENKNGNDENDDKTDNVEVNGKKILIAYFSATNTTKRIAEFIAEELNADLYEIMPAEPYSSADLNYNSSSSRASKENADDNARPKITNSVSNMGDYDIVFIGYPIWWGKAPKIVYAFIESYDFSGKTAIPFCTSASSGIGSSATNLARLTSGVTWLSVQRFSSNSTENAVANWVNGLNY